MQSILFSTEMVKALMADRKTETRRMRGLDEINENPDGWALYPYRNDDGTWSFHKIDSGDDLIAVRIKQPFEKGPCWIRESFRYDISPLTHEDIFSYKADGAVGRMKPSIHMPFIAARNFIHIDEVRLEQLHDITEEGAISEGVKWNPFDDREEISDRIYYNYINRSFIHLFAKHSFESLIISINGPECWEKNMWVWVIKFHRISKPNQ